MANKKRGAGKREATVVSFAWLSELCSKELETVAFPYLPSPAQSVFST